MGLAKKNTGRGIRFQFWQTFQSASIVSPLIMELRRTTYTLASPCRA
jgi:hypothetical protein